MSYSPPPGTVDRAENAGQLTQRIRNLISTVALDCDCRQRVNDALQRFVAQEQARHDRRCLSDARQQRASIAALVELLGELEEVSWQEVIAASLPSWRISLTTSPIWRRRGRPRCSRSRATRPPYERAGALSMSRRAER